MSTEMILMVFFVVVVAAFIAVIVEVK